MFKTIHLKILYVLFAITSCTKEEIPKVLPPVTSEGKNTFGCRVNGVLFMPTGFKADLDVEYYPWKISPEFYGTFVLTAWRSGENGRLESCQIGHPKILSTGVYYIAPNNSVTDTSGHGSCQIWGNSYFSNSQSGLGKINILRYDTISRILSGTFNFWVCNKNNNKDTVFVTDGRFDVKY